MKNTLVPLLPQPCPFFLSTLTASRSERRLAGGALFLSLLAFVVIAPFAKWQLPAIAAFIPIYQSALVVIDLITAALLFNQYISFNSRALSVLGCGYLFSAAMTVVHTLTFPGLFASGGLLGAGPQSTAWLYMFWHGGFPLFVVGYALTKRGETGGSAILPAYRQSRNLMVALGSVLGTVACLGLLATLGQDLLPPIMLGNKYTPSMIFVISAIWLFGLGALLMLWVSKPHSVLDLWLMVVMVAWLIDVALSAMLNQGRFDLGFYAGRIYGLLAASFVLLVLLAESGILYKQLVQLTATLQRLTTQDALTGIANRRAFDGALDAEWRRAQRSGQPLSLMMIDVDHFKDYNDRYGHIAGDKCLQAVAEVLHAGVPRATDLVARYGGEEFAVLLPQTDVAAAAGLAERLRQSIEALSLSNSISPGNCVSVSIGVAGVHLLHSGEVGNLGSKNGGPTLLVEAADRQLYAAKAAGRNRVEVARQGDVSP